MVDLREAYRLGLSNTVVKDLLGGTPDEVPERYDAGSPIELVPLGVRQLLIHGEDDDIVPLSISQRYLAAAYAAGDTVSLVAVPKAGHFDLIDPESAAWPKVAAGFKAMFGIREETGIATPVG